MKVKFSYNHWGRNKTRTLTLQSNVSEDDIKSMFPFVLGIHYNEEYCTYEIIQEGD